MHFTLYNMPVASSITITLQQYYLIMEYNLNHNCRLWYHNSCVITAMNTIEGLHLIVVRIC